MLSVQNIDCCYANVQVLRGVSFAVAEGEIVGLMGRNGAGKTTALKAIMGLVRTRAGCITLNETILSDLPAHEVPKQGVAYVPQGRRLFPWLSVRENLEMGLLVNAAGDDTLEWVLSLFPALRERIRQRAGTLSGGEQQMLAMARALCTRPQLLLLDEPSEGLMPSLVEKLLETVNGLREQRVAVLLVEQKVDAVLQVADRAVFVENGRVQHQTSIAELNNDHTPLARYVGVSR
ncbi:MAG: ABC transporter ATP-binding protein [Gammaproteobacteria bacterium]|nr:ABC transporter ATP-binding protein [Gammaproteobacteria bacterium]